MPAKLLVDGPGDVKEFKDLKTLLERPTPPLAETTKGARAAARGGLLNRIEQQVSPLLDQIKLAAFSLERLQRDWEYRPTRIASGTGGTARLEAAAFLERATLIAKQSSKAATDFSQQRAEVKKIFERLAFQPGMDGKSDFYWDAEFERNLRAMTSDESKP